LKKSKKIINIGPITAIIFMSIILMLLSFLLNKIGYKGYITNPETHEKTLVTVNNIFSRTGLKYIFSSTVSNFRLIEPLVILIMSFITLSIIDSSGLLNHVVKPLKSVKHSYITFALVFISVISTFLGDYCYAILLPFAGVLYKYLDRDPKNGIIITYIGITMGYATGIFYNYQDLVLNNYSATAAKDVIFSFKLNPLSSIYLLIASSLIITLVFSNIIDKKFSKKIRKDESEQEKFIESGIALKTTGICFLVMILISAYCIIPGLPFSGLLLNDKENLYIAKLMGDGSPFKDGFLFLFIIIFMICGYIYGRISRNIKNAREYNKSISKAFENTGFLFATLFFSSIMINILDWTKIGEVFCLNIISSMEKLEFSGFFLIVATLIMCFLATILIPSTVKKWELISPTMVPLLMRANISPAYTQMVFKVGDAIGKCFSPVYIYLFVLIGLLYKYEDNGEEIKLFSTIKKMMPFVIILAITWLAIILGWYLVGIKIGVGTLPTI